MAAEERQLARNPYIAIMVAAQTGVGVRLSADECWDMAHDDAIATYATNCLEQDELHKGWTNINPARARNKPNNRVGIMSLNYNKRK